MLELMGLSGLVAFVVASFVVGIRILGLARRTRGLPETLIGLSLLIAGGLGTGLSVLPLLFTTLPTSTSYFLYQIGSVANHVGYSLLLLFVWRVFRPGMTWAAILFVACLVALAAGATGLGLTLIPGDSIMRPTGVAYQWLIVSLAARLVGYGWASIESLRYYGMLRRRAKLGLADPLTAKRFFHWGICTSAVVGIWLNMAAELLLPVSEGSTGAFQLISALLSFVVAGSLSLAFFPRTPTDEVDTGTQPSAGEQSVG